MLHWLKDIANAREHRTTKCMPQERFTTVEQPVLQRLPDTPYRSLVLPPAARAVDDVPGVPRVAVERRDLAAYDALAAGGDA